MKHVHLFRNLACLLIGTVLSVASARALTFPVTKTAGGGPTAVVPTLSFPMLALLAVALAGAAVLLIRRA